jgi:ATPase subunit of ABC transporter with duplicated ATPase domains
VLSIVRTYNGHLKSSNKFLSFFLRGNYDQFHKTKTEKHKNQQREYEAQQQHRAHTQEFIDRFRYNANRASSVQSKIKMLDKLYVSSAY